MTAYYNEFDSKIADWLRELIKEGLIAHGEVDERSIVDVEPSDLRGFSQHHFFAGIGGWSYALRLAGWPDDSRVWTASLPCQPFSAAGKGLGKSDERHLLPHFLELVKECKPSVIFGEQVSAAIRHGWLDDLYAEMEACDYAVGSIIIGAHSSGAAHIRQRLYWVAHSSGEGLQEQLGKRNELPGLAETSMASVWMGDSASNNQQRNRERETCDGSQESFRGSSISWIYCRDGKYRPIEPSIFKMAARLSSGMVCCSHTSIENNEYPEEGKVNGTKNKTNSREILQSVQQEDGKEEIQQSAGGLDRIQKQEILQSGVYGESLRWCDKGTEPKEFTQAVSEESERVLRGVFKDNHSSCSSCGRKSFEQRTIEFDDIVRDMPQGSTLAQLLGSEGAQYMQALRKTGDEDWPLLDAQHPAKEIWESFNDEEKDRIRIHFNNRAWVMDEAINPLVDGVPRGMVHSSDPNNTQEARVMRLKGYGNAIVPQVAAQFIGAYMAIMGDR